MNRAAFRQTDSENMAEDLWWDFPLAACHQRCVRTGMFVNMHGAGLIIACVLLLCERGVGDSGRVLVVAQ